APLKVFAVTGDPQDKEVEYAELRGDKPTVYVFVSAKEFDRPVFRYLKKLDEDVGEEALVVAVWVTDEADKSKEYLPNISDYFKQAALTVLGGARGQNGWGINTDAHLTAVIAHEGKVVKSFAYVSLNETDVPAVVAAVKKVTKK